MVGVKETSEKVLMTMQILSTLISISLPGMAISFVIVIIGFVMLAKAKTESKEKDEEKEEEKEIPHKHGKQYCHNCGAAVSKKDEFCGECGEKIKK
jgi:flagellar biosynthesis component FlhA